MAGVVIEQPVRWGDMDALGHVNNTVYFRFCESARIAYFEKLELERWKRGPRDGPGLVAASLNFRHQVTYPATLRVHANVTRIGRRSFTLSYRLYEVERNLLVADGDSVCVWVDYEAGRALPLPSDMKEAMARLEERPEGIGE